VFALSDCPHCKRAKAALLAREIPYTEISLSTHPEKRTDMLSLADQLTVPQIFFNDAHIGGADAVLALLAKWDDEAKFSTPLERYQSEIEAKDDPTDPRLQVPTTPPKEDRPAPPRNESEDSIDIMGKKKSILQVTQHLMETLPKADLKYRGTIYKNSFLASDGVNAIMKAYPPPCGFTVKEDAIKFGQTLQQRGILHHVTGDHTFQDNSKLFFRLQPFHTPRILNSFRVWTDRVDSDDPLALSIRLKKAFGKVESNATDNDGNMDYVAAASDPKYFEFEEAVCELQGIKMEPMDRNTTLAFGINVYNLMVKYAFIKVGIPITSVERSSFFGKVSFDIGGDVMSFSDLENGVLRGNKRAPYALSVPFSKDDPRRRLALDKMDNRIHFGLNCGAKSCPPVKKFSADAIEEELRIVAQAFCEQDDNVGINEEKYELSLNTILNWYRSDFAESKEKLPEAVVGFLRNDKRAKLQRMIDSKKSITVKFTTYDWGTNASNQKKHKSSALIVDEKSVTALLST